LLAQIAFSLGITAAAVISAAAFYYRISRCTAVPENAGSVTDFSRIPAGYLKYHL